MKQFKSNPDLYTITELVAFDACLYDLYKDKRPYFFVNILLEKLENAKNIYNQNYDTMLEELVLGLSHLS